MVKVDFYDCDYDGAGIPTYVIIGARYQGKWMFVKSRKRGSYELPAGHIDSSETADKAAGRELSEETGAVKFTLECLNFYSVEDQNSIRWGKLFLAEILVKGAIEDQEEIENSLCTDIPPDNLTFPDVQMPLFNKLSRYLLNG